MATKKKTTKKAAAPQKGAIEKKYNPLVVAAEGVMIGDPEDFDKAADIVRELAAMEKVIEADFKEPIEAAKAVLKAVEKQKKGHTGKLAKAKDFVREKMIEFKKVFGKDAVAEGVVFVEGKKAELYDMEKLVLAAAKNPLLLKLFSVNLSVAKEFMDAGFDVPGVKKTPTSQMRVYPKKGEDQE